MTAGDQRAPAELYDAFIKSEWQDIFRKEVHVQLDNGSRYVPNGGSQGVSLLRRSVNAFDEAIRLWSGPTDEPIGSSQGYDRIVDQAGIQYTWEWFLIEPGRPWVDAVPELVRRRIEDDLARRDQAALARAKARAEQAERDAEAEDDRVIAVMNARRAESGKPPLSADQEADVRAGRRERRAAQR
ncbi:hypothetical protein [Capillimicrobium parvum]|uniref:Uncharacterized protein n=1 Tax=Capillimicrobium parvum TaxID=2884022 RepID=A0A9E6XXX6_9ACTN|nr:hypothetical protein [Capillimicrobium parvum]UGS36455.1 hypothetical protein DSM104329_02861 [Capillimicrobium parvum]